MSALSRNEILFGVGAVLAVTAAVLLNIGVFKSAQGWVGWTVGGALLALSAQLFLVAKEKRSVMRLVVWPIVAGLLCGAVIYSVENEIGFQLVLAFLILLGFIGGMSLVFCASQYGNEKYVSPVQMNIFKEVWNQKSQFQGPGWRLQLIGVVLIAIGIISSGIYGVLNLIEALS